MKETILRNALASARYQLRVALRTGNRVSIAFWTAEVEKAAKAFGGAR